MRTLPVPYISQIQQGALEHNNDCGAASTLMLLRAYNVANNSTVDSIYNQMVPSGDVALSAGSMQTIMARNGLKTEWKAEIGLADLFTYMSEKKPFIALIHYAPLVDAGYTQKTAFRGAHFVVITGIDIEHVNVQDPYRNDGVEDVEIPHTTFMKAWTQCTIDGNPERSGIVTKIQIQDLSVPTPITGIAYEMKTGVNGINVRSGPGSTYPVLKTIWRTVYPTILVSEIVGSWAKLADGSGYVYAPLIVKKV